MWIQKIETATKEGLREFQGDGASLWSQYEQTRADIIANVLPWVGSQEPDLTDHGVVHIANVMRNVGQVLGMNGAGAIYPDAPLCRVLAVERLLLLLGCLLHDVGNIRGRDRHNLVTGEVWRNSGNSSYGLWKPADRRTILAICQAHTGKAPDGSSDTLKPLASGPTYFLGENIPLAKLAATLRFADELAEGSQRTSRFLLFQGLYGVGSVDYHRYANTTHVIIDRANGRVALNFDIELSDPGINSGEGVLINLRKLLSLIFKRVLKLENERIYARHYAPDLLAFSETSVFIDIQLDHERVCELPPLVLNDFNLRSPGGERLAAVDPAYDVDAILAKVSQVQGGSGDA